MPATDLNTLNLDMEVGAAYDEYEKPINAFRPPDPGEYTLLRSVEQPLNWQPTKDADIWTNVRFIIQGGDANGRNVFDTLSTFVGKFRNASSVQDFLTACGWDGVPENGKRFTAQEIMDAVEQTYGPFDAYIDWQAYCPECGKTVIRNNRGFPRDSEGNLLHVVECPECAEEGTKTTVTAKARVKRYIVR